MFLSKCNPAGQECVHQLAVPMSMEFAMPFNTSTNVKITDSGFTKEVNQRGCMNHTAS